MPRNRDFKAEYARRKARAAERGLSLSQARGHPRGGEKGVRPIKFDPALEVALKAMRSGQSLKVAASGAKVSRERLSRYAKDQAGASRSGARWTFYDRRKRRVQVIHNGAVGEIWVEGYHRKLKRPALSRYGATSPDLLRWFSSWNDGKDYADGVKPFGFLYALHAKKRGSLHPIPRAAVAKVRSGEPTTTRVSLAKIRSGLVALSLASIERERAEADELNQLRTVVDDAGSIRKAAQVLGVDFSNLSKRLKVAAGGEGGPSAGSI